MCGPPRAARLRSLLIPLSAFVYSRRRVRRENRQRAVGRRGIGIDFYRSLLRRDDGELAVLLYRNRSSTTVISLETGRRCHRYRRCHCIREVKVTRRRSPDEIRIRTRDKE